MRAIADDVKAKGDATKRNREMVEVCFNKEAQISNPLIKDTLIHGFPIKRLNKMFQLIKFLPAGELFGINSEADSTPFGFDLGKVLENHACLFDALCSTPAKPYGPLWAYFHRFPNSYAMERQYQGLGSDHALIRTGMPITEVSGFIIESDNEKQMLIKMMKMLKIFYPIYDTQGKLLFSYDDYSGL